MHRIFSSTIAATGRQLKQSVNVFHSLILYLRLPAKVKGKDVEVDEHEQYEEGGNVAMLSYIRRKSHRFY